MSRRVPASRLSTMVVAGARPNFMKVAPVLRALREREHAASLVHTGQHYDDAMSEVFFDELGIAEPDHHLVVGSGSHAAQTAGVMLALDPLLRAESPDVLIVVGDVNSTVAAALTAAKLTIPVGHVEAGLRSRDWAMPEEVNRVVTDRLSSLLFAPSADAVDNLRAEGMAASRIHLVGNVMIDTLLQQRDRAVRRPVVADLGLADGFVLLTMHRPANVDDPAHLADLLAAVADAAAGRDVVFPMHPRVRAIVAAQPPNSALVSTVSRLTVLEPVGYLDSLALQAAATIVVTDSGGIQEETTALGVPCVTVRPSTERPITVTDGTNQIAGTRPTVVRAVIEARLKNPGEPRRPALWDGRAAQRTVDAIEVFVANGSPHPTD
ncbi:non-hydrolyzing UDP-N-acetylglucosamine 2-epimerase [Euzebya tangerina]|uniref:non-hydrolyzing UDP-N-acetylglucosamine 2-epimerase n=1 Tax=Euzebya tangerina TaxID=591198 RepID=UPI000E324631|nr:UDP-N-acetylglucosamine 2-epimerase (non-hydrolyzing) [Euzebya tangerina]